MSLSNKVILVSGANRGIGAATVRELLKAGVKKVYAGARDLNSLPDFSDSRVVSLQLVLQRVEAGRQPARAHHALLFQDVIAVVVVDHRVGYAEVDGCDELGPAAIEPLDRGDEVSGDGSPLTIRRRDAGPLGRLGFGEGP